MKTIKIKTKDTTLLCDNEGKGDKLSCKVFENPKKPISYTVKDGKYRYIKHKPGEEGRMVEIEPDRKFETEALKFVGPLELNPRHEIGVASLYGFGKGEKMEKVRKGKIPEKKK